MDDHFLFIDIVWMLNSASFLTGFRCRPSKTCSLLAPYIFYPFKQLFSVLQAELHQLHQPANCKQTSAFPLRRGFGPIRSPTEKMKGKSFKQDHTPCQKKWCFAQLLVSVAATADTVVAKNVFWACDNNSQTSKHWKQTNEATYCIDLLIWQIALEWVSSCSHL